MFMLSELEAWNNAMPNADHWAAGDLIVRNIPDDL